MGSNTVHRHVLLRPPNAYDAWLAERTRAGVKAAKGRGVKFGRKPKLTAQQIGHAQKLIGQNERPGDVAALLNVSRATLFPALDSDPGTKNAIDAAIQRALYG